MKRDCPDCKRLLNELLIAAAAESSLRDKLRTAEGEVYDERVSALRQKHQAALKDHRQALIAISLHQYAGHPTAVSSWDRSQQNARDS
jgi:hypothetical protein